MTRSAHKGRRFLALRFSMVVLALVSLLTLTAALVTKGQGKARASAIDELVTSGDLEELGSDKTQLDRELSQLASQQQVDQELEQMKAEVGSGGEKKEIEGAPPAS